MAQQRPRREIESVSMGAWQRGQLLSTHSNVPGLEGLGSSSANMKTFGLDKGPVDSSLPVVKCTDVADHRLADADFLRVWRLPRATDKCDVLAKQNPLSERDVRICFKEDAHVYYVDGVAVPQSCTGFLGQYHETFVPEMAVRAMRTGKNWITKRETYYQRPTKVL